MIKENQNLVIICGMAHSGTTVIAHVLRQHPELTLFKNGSMSYILENDYLLEADERSIEKLLEGGDRVILKRPWVEYHQTDWLIHNFPDAYYLYCIKEKERTIKSWSRPNSYVSDEFRSRSYEQLSEVFDHCYEIAMRIKDNVNHFYTLDNEEVIKNPESIFPSLNQFLNLGEFEYDLSDISSSKPIKNLFVPKEQNKIKFKDRILYFLMDLKKKLTKR